MGFFAEKDGMRVGIDSSQIPAWREVGYRIGMELPYYLDDASELSTVLSGGSISINSVAITAAGPESQPLMARSLIQELYGTEHEISTLATDDVQTVIREVLGQRTVVDMGTGPAYGTVKVDDKGRVISVEVNYED